jgi:hypothetical protein
MSEFNVNSYDLQQAQHLLNLLITQQAPSPRIESAPLDPPSYSNLATSPLVKSGGQKKDTPGTGSETTDVEEADLTFETFDCWEDFIAWCMNKSRAEAAFVVDSQGFVIASRGRVPSQGFEGAGAELICSIEQLERIAPDAGKLSCVDLDFHKRRLVGFVASTDETTDYVVGLVAPDALATEKKMNISLQISNNQNNLT